LHENGTILSYESVGDVLISLLSAMHGPCVTRPTVTSPASEHHRPLTATKLYCLVTAAHRCQHLA